MRLFFTSLATIAILFSAAHVRADDKAQSMDQLKPDFDKPKAEAKDGKHDPVIDAPATVNAGDWFPVKISLPAHPSLVDHSVRWISLEADGVEINRVYLHPVMSKPEVTFVIALPDERTLDKEGQISNRKDRIVTLRAVEAPNHTSQWWQEKKITVKSPAGGKAAKK
jgi:desulfoferrodoxin (superoxide reductase-like protein)